MLALSSKYALALYEMVQKRGNLSHQWSETFEIGRLRDPPIYLCIVHR